MGQGSAIPGAPGSGTALRCEISHSMTWGYVNSGSDSSSVSEQYRPAPKSPARLCCFTGAAEEEPKIGHRPVRFVPLSKVQELGRLPRYGTNKDFVHPLTGESNENMCLPREAFDDDNTLFVFVSHRWIRPRMDVSGHPDTPDHHKCKLIISAAQQFVGPRSLAPPNFSVGLWIDYCCVDQDNCPAEELNNVGRIMQCCDLMLTPVVDPEWDTWEIEGQELFSAYKAKAWDEYWKRAWCRVEAMFAAVVPVPGCETRANRFHPGALRNAIAAGRRMHFVFGTKELKTVRPPKGLPALLNSFFDDYSPEKGALTKEQDRLTILRLTKEARSQVVELKVGYEGEVNAAGEPHGQGKYTFATGAIYEGQYVSGKMHGQGKMSAADGGVYTGEWREGLKHGRAFFYFPDGGVIDGHWVNGKKNGHCVLRYPDGITVYEGQYTNDRRHGIGKMTYGDGITEVGTFREGRYMSDVPLIAEV